jgi:hypothetical protein
MANIVNQALDILTIVIIGGNLRKNIKAA